MIGGLRRKYKHFTWDNRIAISSYLKAKIPIKEIATLLGVHFTTIYREIKRGLYLRKDTNLVESEHYSPDIADEKYRQNLKEKGRDLKIGSDIVLANFIERMIIEEKYSPEAVILYIQENELEFKTTLCVRTLYNYIDEEIFLELTNDNLPNKRNKKRGYRPVRKRSKIFGDSI